MQRLAILALLTAVGCGGASSNTTPAPAQIRIPARADTFGDDLLGLVPKGADVLLELNLARLRDNPVIGKLVRSVKPGAGTLEPRLLAKTDLVVFAAYRVGSKQARTLTLLRGKGLTRDDVVGSSKLLVKSDKGNTLALAEPALLAELDRRRRNPDGSVRDDRALMRTRALAMPAKAKAATLRMTANLDFEARVSLAKVLQVDGVPGTVSVWGDVIDDLAVIALLGGTERGEAQRLVSSAVTWRGRLAGNALVRKLFLGYLVRGIEVKRVGRFARLKLYIGPRRLSIVTKRLTKDSK